MQVAMVSRDGVEARPPSPLGLSAVAVLIHYFKYHRRRPAPSQEARPPLAQGD